MSFSFSSPADLNAQVSAAISAGALAISGGGQTTILANLPTGSTWPTFIELEAAGNKVRSLYDAAMSTSRATGSNAAVAATAASWDALCGFRNMFDVAREEVVRDAVPLS